MPEFTFDPDKHIAVDNRVYERDSLSPEHSRAVSLINHTDQEIATATANLDVMKLGRERMVALLVEAMAELEPVAELKQESAQEVE